MFAIHVSDRALFYPDDFGGVVDAGENVAGVEVGGAGKAAVEMRRDDVQTPEREVTESCIDSRFRVARQKATLHPNSVRRVTRHVDETAENRKTRMGKRITLPSSGEQYGRTRIDFDICCVGGQPRYQ